MTKDFLDMLHLFSCGATGKNPENREYNLNEILRLSGEQGVFPFVFLSLQKLFNESKLSISEADFVYLQSQYTQAVFSSIRKNAAVNQTLKYLEENGISCCMLKGQILSGLYAVPEARISGDTDLLMPSADMEEKVCEIFKNIGFEIIPRPKTSHHAMCKRQDTGLIELHLSLYDELFEDIWFKNKGEKPSEYVKITTAEGYTYKTLGYTDNAIFITLHAIKHFFTEGVGIRQIMDMLLFNIKYKDKIDFDKYNKLMKKLKFSKLIDHIKFIGKEYLDLDTEYSADVDKDNIDAILTDIETGGLFGKEDSNRQQFYKASTKERSGKTDEDYNKYIEEWMGNLSLKSKLFPSLSDMTKMYKTLNKHKYLLPFFWIKRLFGIFVYKIKPKPSHDKRLELLKNLDII